MKFDLYGSEASAIDFSALDVLLVPCASRITLFDGSVVGGEEDCIWDRNKMEEVFDDAYNFMVYHNQHEFQNEDFGEDTRIKYVSTLQAIFSTTHNARWTMTPIELNKLIDEVALFQLG